MGKFKNLGSAQLARAADHTSTTVTTMSYMDPKYYGDRLARLPKLVVLSSDDEFMMMDWSNIWYRNLTDGEADLHLLIAQNSEHSLATGIPEVLPALSVFLSSIAHGHPPSRRPSFEFQGPDPEDGTMTLAVPMGRACLPSGTW